MDLKINEPTGLLDTPGGAVIGALFADTVITVDGSRPDPAFHFVTVRLDGRSGWVDKKACAPLEAAGPIPEDRYVREALAVEASLNARPATAPFFMSADLLLARRHIEAEISGLLALAAAADGLGPLKMRDAEWATFLADGGEQEGYRPGHRGRPGHQLWAAARRLVVDARELSRLKTDALGSGAESFVPSYLDAFHCYLTGSAAAALRLGELDQVRAATPTDASLAQPVTTVLAGVIGEPAVAALSSQRNIFSAAVGVTVADFLDATTSSLTEGLKVGFELIKTHAPEFLPILRSGDAPWFDSAMTFEPRKLSETTDKAEIIGFFAATDHGTPTRLPHWCGAFVAHCLKAALGKDAAVPQGAARAANWRGWGQTIKAQSDDVPQGAVVVLSPEPGTNTSGHVAFFDRFVDRTGVSLLGGNQSDTVRYTVFRRSRIVHIGWPDTHDRAIAQAGQGPASQRGISEAAFAAIIGFEVSSQQRYEARYRRPIWPEGRSGVTIGIGYDLGQQKAATIEADWRDQLPAPMLAAAKRCAGVTGAPSRQLAKEVAAAIDVPWPMALAVHHDKVLPRFVGLVERSLDNVAELNGDSLGALVSLTFNRGASYKLDGERYREMRKIRIAMRDRQFSAIPGHIRDMQWIWPDSEGLKARRRAEADLFQRGLP
jgi:hypothetical protein